MIYCIGKIFNKEVANMSMKIWFEIILINTKTGNMEKIARVKSKGVAFRLYKEVQNIYRNTDFKVKMK